MKTRLTLLIAAFAFSGSMALAALSTQDVIDGLNAQGYTRVEVKVGPTQTKVEAIRGTEKLEVVYDNASGSTLKSEVGTVEAGDDTAPGVSIRNRKNDFVDGADDGDDGDEDENDDNDGSDDGDGDHDNEGEHEGGEGGNSGHDGGDD
jgi:hypothetical protein